MSLHLPELPFAKDSLAPHMSADTFDYHHGKHHNAYVVKGNELLADAGIQSHGFRATRSRHSEDRRCTVQQCGPTLQSQLLLE